MKRFFTALFSKPFAFKIERDGITTGIVWLILLLIITISLITGCTSSPVVAPTMTQAKAAQDQAKYLDSIYTQLKRIADHMETANPKH